MFLKIRFTSSYFYVKVTTFGWRKAHINLEIFQINPKRTTLSISDYVVLGYERIILNKFYPNNFILDIDLVIFIFPRNGMKFLPFSGS